MSTKNPQKKVALVTGANKGIGFETVRQLAQQGVTVLLGARDEARGTQAAEKLRAEGLDVQFLHLDVDNPAAHENAAKFIADKFGKLDILVNNAGIQVESGEWGQNNASTVTQEALRRTFDTNFFNVVALTQKLLPLMRKSEAGRIVNLSSILGSLTLHSDPTSPIYATKVLAYNASKAALNQFTVHLAAELKGTNIKVNSAHPGWVKTDMGTDAAPMEVADGAKTSVQLATLPDDGPTGGYFHLGEPLPW
jgi:NAD(P)-dependent dehydrogenase (short-subunit alcohol dehydrogenase family)